MRTLIVSADQDGRRLVRYIAKMLPAVPMSTAQMFVRQKKVRVNGKSAHAEDSVRAGDEVALYIPDACFVIPKRQDPFLSKFRAKLDIVYEDQNILLADKRPGLAVHPDEGEKVDTLINHVRAYLYQKGEYDSTAPGAFSPALCNRIDRFTGGIVIAAKNAQALHAVDDMIREREIGKYYLCAAKGRISPPSGIIDDFIYKGEAARRVAVLDSPAPGAKRAQTRYSTLAVENGMSLVECELLTGRTHQIRAQFAHIGHPILGDTQYGDRAFNERMGRGYQALYAYRVAFGGSPEGPMGYLSGRSFQVRHVPFARQYFPDAIWARGAGD